MRNACRLQGFERSLILPKSVKLRSYTVSWKSRGAGGCPTSGVNVYLSSLAVGVEVRSSTGFVDGLNIKQLRSVWSSALCLHSVASLQREQLGGSFETLYSACLMQKRQVHFVMLFTLFSPLITVSLYRMRSMLQTLTRDHDHAWSNTANYMQWARFLRALGLLGKAPTHNTIETGSAQLLIFFVTLQGQLRY